MQNFLIDHNHYLYCEVNRFESRLEKVSLDVGLRLMWLAL